MRKLFLLMALVLIFMPNKANAIVDTYGEHIHWADTIIVENDTVETQWIDIAKFPYLGIMVRTTNVADSTKYTMDYFIAYDTTEVLTPCDENGTADNQIWAVTDSSSIKRCKSLQAPIGRWLKARIITNTTANGCGNRIHFWVKTYSWRPE